MNVEISDRAHFSNILLRTLSSSKLALVLVLLLIIFSIFGAVVPQEETIDLEGFALWQSANPGLTAVLKPLGLFHVFRSLPFLAIILILGVNTLTCTVLHLIKEGGGSFLKGPKAIERLGFLLVHFSLIVLFAGGLWSGAKRLGGFLILTEGQQGLLARQGGYFRLIEGRVQPEHDGELLVFLKKVRVEYEKRHPVAVTSEIAIFSPGRKPAKGEVKFNDPFDYNGLAFTQSETGFSPRLVIREAGSGRLLLDSFVALKTFSKGTEREYRDFLPLPFFKKRVIITLYPSFSRDNDKVKKEGDAPENPLLLIEEEDESGRKKSLGYLPAGNSITFGEYSFLFAGLRQWSMFRIVKDPGYFIVMISLWLGMGALALRYLPDLWRWFREEPVRQGETEVEGRGVKGNEPEA